MKISEMIKNLQEFMDEHGDIDCWYASDDEGNGYHPVSYNPTLFYADVYYGEVHTLRDIEEDENDPDDYAKICVVN